MRCDETRHQQVIRGVVVVCNAEIPRCSERDLSWRNSQCGFHGTLPPELVSVNSLESICNAERQGHGNTAAADRSAKPELDRRKVNEAQSGVAREHGDRGFLGRDDDTAFGDSQARDRQSGRKQG